MKLTTVIGRHLQRCFASLVLCLVIACALLTASPCSATNRTWTGNSGKDFNWMTPSNWMGDMAPSAGDSLIFPGVLSGGNLTNNNNYPVGTTFGNISISSSRGQDYAIGGNRVVLTGGLAESEVFGAGGVYVFFDITLSGSQTFTATGGLNFNDTIDTDGNNLILNNSGSVVFNGTLTNSHGLEANGFSLAKTNLGMMTISSNGTISAASVDFDVVLGEGTLLIDGTATGFTICYVDQASLIVDGSLGQAEPRGFGGTISGSGYIGNIYQYSDGSATIIPGDNGAPGTMECFFFENTPIYTQGPDTLVITIDGPTFGTDYSILEVQDSYTFGPGSIASTPASTTLALQGTYTPQVGDYFYIVFQFSALPYSVTNQGYFSGLPPDSILDATNGASLGISYTSNYVYLETLRSTNSQFVLWKGSISPDISAYESRDWSLTNNWSQGAGPTNGDVLVFSPYQMSAYDTNGNLIPGPPITNDLPDDTSLAGLYFTGTNYSLYGNPLSITGGVTNYSFAGTNFCYIDIAAAGPLSLDAEFVGYLVMDDVIAGNGTINKSGFGTVIYTGTTEDAFFGTVAVYEGTLEIDGTFTDGSFNVYGGMLDGSGSVSAVTMYDGTLKPGDSPGILRVEGNLTMEPNATFEAELDGLVPGSGYDQLQVTGNINLNGATLNLQPDFAASVGTEFLILANQGANPITGTFAGLSEGQTFQANGQVFSISYQAGPGNKNVVITRVNPPNLTGILSLPPTAVQILGTGVTNAPYTILANTNLATTNWVNIGTVNANSLGTFFFNDSNVLLFPQRFYEVQ